MIGNQRGIPSDIILLSFSDISQQMNSSRWHQYVQYEKASSVSGKNVEIFSPIFLELSRNVVHLIFSKGFPYRLSLFNETKSMGIITKQNQSSEPFLSSLSQLAHQHYNNHLQSQSTVKSKSHMDILSPPKPPNVQGKR